MRRSKHTLSHYRLATMKMGMLYPIAAMEVLPGDTVQHHTDAMIRVTPLNTPVMHPTRVRIHHFYVPNRLTFPEPDGWETFITGGKAGTSTPAIPDITTDGDKSNVLSHLGVPPIAGITVNAMPLIAFNKIFNEYFRDQDIVPERGDKDLSVPKISWEKDYFTTSRPFTQKGPDISLPIGGTAPVNATGTPPGFRDGASTTFSNLAISSGSADASWSTPGASNSLAFWNNPGLEADLSASTGANINDVRSAFALQRYAEARARYGSRYTEYLRYLGITPSDARLQRPEYLGGGTARLNFSEVLQTTPAANAGEAGVGDLYGHGIAGVRSNAYRKFFEESGYIISVMSVRPKSIYVNGIPRTFIRKTKEDFFQRELANLGQQEVYKKEVYGVEAEDVFGYQDRYDEYRYQQSQVVGDFRDTLNAWHMGRILDANVALNPSFVECDPATRIYQVETTDPLWCMINHHVVARRIVPKRANPRVL